MPIYRFIRSRQVHAREAEDLTQEFMVHLLEKSLFSRADPLLGRFRSFLLGALVRFLNDVTDKQGAIKRGGGRQHLSLGVDGIPDHRQVVGAPDTALFDREWGLGILESALQRVRSEYEDRHRQDFFAQLQQFLPGFARRVPYDQAAQELGIPLAALKTEVHRLRCRLRALVREEVALTVSAPHEVEPEMAYLQEVLMRHSGVETGTVNSVPELS